MGVTESPAPRVSNQHHGRRADEANEQDSKWKTSWYVREKEDE